MALVLPQDAREGRTWARRGMTKATANMRADREQNFPVQHREKFLLWEMQSVPAGVRLSSLPARAGHHLVDGNLRSPAVAVRHEPISPPSCPFRAHFSFFLLIAESNTCPV